MASRLLIGHGNASASDVGLTVHRTWGTPVIPGTALKGLLSGYVDAVYGPGDAGPQADRDDWAAPTWCGFNVTKAPGRWHALVFGSPAVSSDDEYRYGLRGGVTFHDALYIPSDGDNRCYELDVLTVHQKPYYDSHGGEWPNDWNAPVPVPFLTVKPGVRFLISLEGPPRATALAMTLLLEALSKWGVGAKTSLGYGAIISGTGPGGETHGSPARTPGAEWVDATIARVMAEHRIRIERDAVQGEPLARAWDEIENDDLKQGALEDIVARWQANGMWDDPQAQGRAARRAKRIYEAGA